MSTKEIICTCCPKGCHLAVDETTFAVSGNGCPRGVEYGANELRNPVRTLTTTVVVTGGRLCRLPVRTDKPIPKGMLFEAMRQLDGVSVAAPVRLGQVILSNICGSGADVTACCDCGKE